MTMTRERRTKDRGQVGIGTLIVFIAMVLVAAIAAGVLINTAGFLQTSAEDTGEETQEQVTDRVQVLSEVGEVDTDGGPVNEVTLTVSKAPGAGDINLEEVTIHWIGPEESGMIINNGDNNVDGAAIGGFQIEEIGDGDDNVLTQSSDRYELTMDIGDADFGENGDALEAGDSATLTITTAGGAEQIVGISAPESLEIYESGETVDI